MSRLIETVTALRKFLVDRLAHRRPKLGMTEAADQGQHDHPRMGGELKPYLTRKGAVVTKLEPLAADEPHRYVYEIASPELIAIEDYLASLKQRAVVKGHQR